VKKSSRGGEEPGVRVGHETGRAKARGGAKIGTGLTNSGCGGSTNLPGRTRSVTGDQKQHTG